MGRSAAPLRGSRASAAGRGSEFELGTHDACNRASAAARGSGRKSGRTTLKIGFAEMAVGAETATDSSRPPPRPATPGHRPPLEPGHSGLGAGPLGARGGDRKADHKPAALSPLAGSQGDAAARGLTPGSGDPGMCHTPG